MIGLDLPVAGLVVLVVGALVGWLVKGVLTSEAVYIRDRIAEALVRLAVLLGPTRWRTTRRREWSRGLLELREDYPEASGVLFALSCCVASVRDRGGQLSVISLRVARAMATADGLAVAMGGGSMGGFLIGAASGGPGVLLGLVGGLAGADAVALARVYLAWRDKAYIGTRTPGDRARIEVEANGDRRPLRHIVHHSPTGLEWGYGGSGPSDAACSILADATGERPAPAEYQQFKWQVVANLPREGFRLEAEHVIEWHDNYVAEREQTVGVKELSSSPNPAPGGAGTGTK